MSWFACEDRMTIPLFCEGWFIQLNRKFLEGEAGQGLGGP